MFVSILARRVVSAMRPHMRVKRFKPEIAMMMSQVSVDMVYPIPMMGRCCGAPIEKTWILLFPVSVTKISPL